MSTIKKSCCDGNYVFGGEHHSVECKTEIHKPNAAMYGLCQKCRDYFDNSVNQKLYSNEGTEKEHADPDFAMDDNQFVDDDRDFQQSCQKMDESRDMAQMSSF